MWSWHSVFHCPQMYGRWHLSPTSRNCCLGKAWHSSWRSSSSGHTPFYTLPPCAWGICHWHLPLGSAWVQKFVRNNQWYIEIDCLVPWNCHWQLCDSAHTYKQWRLFPVLKWIKRKWNLYGDVITCLTTEHFLSRNLYENTNNCMRSAKACSDSIKLTADKGESELIELYQLFS